MLSGSGWRVVQMDREAARRYGQSQALRLEIDRWRDAAGALWEPPLLIHVQLPHLKTTGKLWAIGEVTYHMDEQGTKAKLVVMPKAAFEPESISLMSFYQDVPPNVGKAKAT